MNIAIINVKLHRPYGHYPKHFICTADSVQKRRNTRRIGGKDQQRVINTQYFKNINIKNYELWKKSKQESGFSSFC